MVEIHNKFMGGSYVALEIKANPEKTRGLHMQTAVRFHILFWIKLLCIFSLIDIFFFMLDNLTKVRSQLHHQHYFCVCRNDSFSFCRVSPTERCSLTLQKKMPTITPCQRTARAGLHGGKDSALVVKYTLYFIPDHQVTFRDLPQRVEDTVFVFDVFVQLWMRNAKQPQVVWR